MHFSTVKHIFYTRVSTTCPFLYLLISATDDKLLQIAATEISEKEVLVLISSKSLMCCRPLLPHSGLVRLSVWTLSLLEQINNRRKQGMSDVGKFSSLLLAFSRFFPGGFCRASDTLIVFLTTGSLVRLLYKRINNGDEDQDQ